jgi:hypothetical protein
MRTAASAQAGTRSAGQKSRRGWGEGGVYYDEERQQWTATVEAPRDPVTGRRRQLRARARTKTEVLAKAAGAKRRAEAGVPSRQAGMTVAACSTTGWGP